MSKTSWVKKDKAGYSSLKVADGYTTVVRTYVSDKAGSAASTSPADIYGTYTGKGNARQESYSSSTNSARDSYLSLNDRLHGGKKNNSY